MKEKTSSLQFIYLCHLYDYGSPRRESISSLQLLFLMSDLKIRSASGHSANTRPSCSRAVVRRVGGHEYCSWSSLRGRSACYQPLAERMSSSTRPLVMSSCYLHMASLPLRVSRPLIARLHSARHGNGPRLAELALL